MKPRLMVAVVADELREKTILIARRHGVRGMSFFHGRGLGFPEHKTFLNHTYRGLENVFVFMIDPKRAPAVEADLNRELRLTEPFRGLVFSLPIEAAAGLDARAMREAETIE